MKRIFFLIFLALSILRTGFSQENVDQDVRILFKGIVLDASTLLPISDSQILINKVFSSISGRDGTFAFYVNRADTVIFRRLGYKATMMFVSDTLKGREFNAGIYMNSDTLAIGEVVIVPRFSNLRSEILNAKSKTPETFSNAKYNVAVSAYQGRNSQGSLGRPSDNYALLRERQKVNAYERGGIPSDRIAGISPLLLIPAAYMLIKGVPEKPEPFRQELTNEEVDQINKKYLEILRKKE
jgi:hypothetical protein